jgi:hypothetical protein
LAFASVADRGHLRVAVGAARDVLGLDRVHVVLAGDQFGDHDALVADALWASQGAPAMSPMA